MLSFNTRLVEASRGLKVGRHPISLRAMSVRDALRAGPTARATWERSATRLQYLFARHNGGTFVLRIEETDRETLDRASRSAPSSRDLGWIRPQLGRGPVPPERATGPSTWRRPRSSRAGAVYSLLRLHAGGVRRAGRPRSPRAGPSRLRPNLDVSARRRPAAAPRRPLPAHALRFRAPLRGKPSTIETS